jgi:thioredoxin reductase (NADPH)
MYEFKTDLVIVGAGPGGLSAALYSKRSGLNFEIVEKLMPGGQIIKTDSIENYPGFKENISGFELAQNLVEHCKKLGIEVRDSFDVSSVELNENNQNGKSYKFKCQSNKGIILTNSLIIATGASPSRLGVEGEEKFIGSGVSFCATCDGALYRDKEVAVVGGGNTALEEAIFLTKFVKRVYVIHRRDELRAEQILRDRAFKNDKIKFLWSCVIERFAGSDRLEEILVRDKKENKTFKLKISAVFEYVGLDPNSPMVSDLVDSDDRGFIITNSRMETSMPGIFAVGDVRSTPLRQVITAVADGSIAAIYADRFLYSLEHG